MPGAHLIAAGYLASDHRPAAVMAVSTPLLAGQVVPAAHAVFAVAPEQ